MTGPDLTTGPDLVTGADLATGPDLPTGPDLRVEPDLATEPDLAVGPDLAVEPDLVVPLTLTSVLPANGPTTGGITLQLTGSGFVAGAGLEVLVDGVTASDVTVVSASELTAMLPARPGRRGMVPVTVRNPDGQEVQRTLFAYYPGTVRFPTHRNYPVTNPRAIAAGDVSGDGNSDLAVGSAGGSVGVLLGNGDGTFRTAVHYPAGSFPESLAVADVSGDGQPDLAVANRGSDNVSVLLGNGDGTLRAAVDYPVGGAPQSVVARDVSGDGVPDLVVANYASNNVSVLLGNSNGTFQAGVIYSAGDFSLPSGVALGDVSGDGQPDIAIANERGGVRVLPGNGDGTFQAAVSHLASLRSIAIGDVNADGRLDLVGAHADGTSVSLLLGNGNGTFQPVLQLPSGPVSGVALSDLDGDGLPDIVATTNILLNRSF